MSVVFQIDASAAEGVKKGLGELQAKTPQVLKNAINSTAKKMRVRMVEQAQKSYTVKKARFNKATTIKNATVRSMTATITAKGEPMELKDFKTSPATPPAKQKRGRSTRARVYSSSQLKPLEKNGIKAFVTRFRNGHVSVAQRRTKKRLPIKVLFSTSIPHMIGNEEKVMEVIMPDIQRVYGDEVSAQMKKIIDKARRTP